ncbi:probable LRR receptor-like serine/threonine-protein kinase [Tanacetum coccineum]
MMSFLTAVVTSRYPTTNNQLRTSSNPSQQATIYDGKVTVQPVQGRQTTYAAGTTRKYTPGASGSNTGKQRTVILPDSIGRLPEFRTVFLNNNSLSGAIPAWVFTANNNRKIDLSYNNYLNREHNKNCVSVIAYYNLFINSGGSSLEFEGNEYEQDLTNEQSYFFPSDERWAYSSNGVYLNNDNVPFVASTANVTGGDIYSTARLAPE